MTAAESFCDDEAKVRPFVDRLVSALTAAPDGAEANKISRHGIDSYVYDAATEQRIVADFRDARPGDKQYHWEQRGVPFRMEVGPRDVDAGAVALMRRQRAQLLFAIVSVAVPPLRVARASAVASAAYALPLQRVRPLWTAGPEPERDCHDGPPRRDRDHLV